ncbi:MAG: Crp/Fnr family transcriptional regulator [Acidobacteriota bacterium]
MPTVWRLFGAAGARVGWHEIRARKGDVLVEIGEPAGDLYVVVRGAVRLESDDGRDAPVVDDIVFGGEAFGEGALLGPGMTDHRARAASTVVAMHAPARLLVDAAARDAAVAAALVALVADIAVRRRRRLHILQQRRAEARLAGVLAELEARARAPEEMGLTQADLAHLAGLSRETVNATLGEWRRLGRNVK